MLGLEWSVCVHRIEQQCHFRLSLGVVCEGKTDNLENLSQKKSAPPVPDRILLASYVSTGSARSQTSQSFISMHTGLETFSSICSVGLNCLHVCKFLSAYVWNIDIYSQKGAVQTLHNHKSLKQPALAEIDPSHAHPLAFLHLLNFL